MLVFSRRMHRFIWIFGMCSMLLTLLLGIKYAYAGQPAAGFWEATSSATAQPPLSASQIAQFLPNQRGPFTFPAPYSTTGIRVTLPSDCPNNANCVHYVGYSYWATMNNSAGSNTMYIMVGLLKSKGGGGPTLYKLDKTTDQVTKVGPIFTDANASQTGETMYFSHSMPDALYYITNDNTTLSYINVLTHVETPVFDVHNYNASDHIFQCGTSFDDKVSACSLEDANWNVIGCIVYNGKGQGGFQVYTSQYGMNECQPSPDGKYIMFVEEKARPGQNFGSTVIIDAQTGAKTVVLNSNGGAGHYALGYGYYIQHNNEDPTYDSEKLWNVNDLSSGADVWDQPYKNQCNYNPTVCAQVPDHPSWLNAVPPSVMPIAKQYVCDSTANGVVKPFSNQVFCYYLDASVPIQQQKSLVIAPTMINTAKDGCGDGNGAYGNDPKGNIDPTGHYFMWSANLDSNNNCQIFLVKIPTSQLPYPPPVLAPPQVSITSPSNSATVSGTITLKAEVSSDVKIANVEWELDGQKLGVSDTAPYAYDLNTDKYSLGQHLLTAVATDIVGANGKAVKDVIVAQNTPAKNSSGGGSLSVSILSIFSVLVFMVARKQRKELA